MTTSNSALADRVYEAFPALAYRNFRYFWFGQCISLMGTWMQRTAQQWLVYTLTKSALLLGFLGVAQFGPVLLFSLFAGVIIDKYPKKNVLIFTQFVLMLQALALAVLVWSGHVRYWNVLILAAIMGFMNTLDRPARQSFVVNLVEKKALANGIALNSTIFTAARIIGPAISVLLIVRFGVGFCFFFNAISFIPVIFGLYIISIHTPQIKQGKEKMFAATLDGLKYIRTNPGILSAILAVLTVGMFIMNFDVIIPVFADQVLDRGAYGYGFLLSASGFGALMSALFLATRTKDSASPKLLYICGLMVSVFMMAASLIHSFILAIVDLAIMGFFNMMFATLANSTIQLIVDDKYRGRVMSAYALGFAGTTPIGNLLTGVVIQRFGAGMGFLMCGGMTFILMAILMLSPLTISQVADVPGGSYDQGNQ